MSANPRPLVATIYNPHTQSKDALIAGFTARKAKFDRLFRDISEAPMTKAEQHYLIQGVRGMGKTTFLLRLAYEIENTPELAQRLIPIVFNEEEYGISSLSDFWERTARYLEEADPTFAGLEDRMAAQYGGDDYERAALQTLLTALHEHDKKLILLIDNIGDLFRKFPEMENKRLREVLLTVPDLRLIGATPTLIEQTHDYTKPYFDFFKVIQLGGLNQQETNDLFLKLGEAYGTDEARELVEKRPGRIEALRRLTGGVIRTMVLLFEIMVENNTGSVFRDLNALIDRVTPLYKHRIDDLPTQQQKIVAALANAWDAATAKELAQVVRLESKVVSAQLRQLINNGIVEKIETNTKNHLYRLEERFFNIWYLMRFGRKTDERALWLIKFFELMFEDDEEWLNERVGNHMELMKIRLLDTESAIFLTKAFANILRDELIEDLLMKQTRKYLASLNREDLSIDIPNSAYENVRYFMETEEYNKAIHILKSLNKKNLQTDLELAICYCAVDQYYDAIKCLEKIVNQDNDVQNNTLSIKKNTKNIIFLLPNRMVYVDENKSKIINYKFISDDNELFAELPLIKSIILTEILLIYFNRKITKNMNIFHKIMNLNYVLIENSKKDQPISILILNMIKIWLNEFDFSPNIDCNIFENDMILDPFAKEGINVESNLSIIKQSYLKLLLAKKQYHTAYKYFQQEEWQLKDRFKPLYYATMYFLQDEYPTEFLRMGPELKETVDDILTETEQMAIDYA